MTRYRRSLIPGGTYFFTLTLADRCATTLLEHIDRLRDVYRHVQTTHPFETVAICILPEHLHAVWTLPAGDANYPLRWNLIKAGFSRGLARRRTTQCQQDRAARERHLAAALLGTPDSRRRRFTAACRLHPHQPSSPRPGVARCRLALFQFSPLRRTRVVAGGLDGWRTVGRELRRVRFVGGRRVGTLRFAHPDYHGTGPSTLPFASSRKTFSFRT